MAAYRVYDNILLKLENVFLKVEMEVDKEITSLLAEHSKLQAHLSDLKSKVEVLNSLKRSFELYYDKTDEMANLNHTLFKVLCEKQIKFRFLQEKELLLSGYLVPMPEMSLPTIIQINKEYKLRKQLQEIELLSSFLAEDLRFEPFVNELERAVEIFDLAVESGAIDKLESAAIFFQHFFEKVLNIYDVDQNLLADLKDFKTQILIQANQIAMFVLEDVASFKTMQNTYKFLHEQRMGLELEVERLLYQFTMFQNGKKIVLGEIKNVSGELESVLFKEYAIKQKIQELRQYKIDLNNQKENFMKDPTVDGYSEAVQQLESVENRFRRLMMHKSFEKQTTVSRFFMANKTKTEHQLKNEEISYNKVLFQVLHNNHIASKDKMVILRLSKPSRLLNTNSGKFFFQRTGKTRSLQNLEKSFKKLQAHEIH